jgi:hypothetical protein
VARLALFQWLLLYHAAMSTVLLYHRLPANFKGHQLLPLNRLRELHPEIAAVHMRRYLGRELLLQRQVPPLSCSRQETVAFSLTPPDVLAAIMREVGHSWNPQVWIGLDARCLEPANAVVYPAKHRIPYSPDTDADFSPFDPKLLETYFEEILTREDYKTCLEKGTPPLLFSNVPTVLYRGTVDISEAVRITA